MTRPTSVLVPLRRRPRLHQRVLAALAGLRPGRSGEISARGGPEALVQLAADLGMHIEKVGPRQELVIYTGWTEDEDDGALRALTDAELEIAPMATSGSRG